MKVVVDFQIIPLGVGPSLSPYIAEVEKVLQEAGLVTRVHAMGTNIEGEWDEIAVVVQRCHDRLAQMGATRIASSVKISDRRDEPTTIDGKLQSLQRALQKA